VPNPPPENVVILHKVNDIEAGEGSTDDTRRGVKPAGEASLEIIEMHSKKYHETLEVGDDYMSMSNQSGLKTKDLNISVQGFKP
jgi:hypothetical protein